MASGLHSAQGAKLLASFLIFDIFAAISVCLRFYIVHAKNMTLRLHDKLCVVSLVTLIGYSIALLIGTVDGGIGLHVTEVPPEQLVIAFKSFFSSQFFWGVSICAFRLSILLLYLEVFGTTRWFRWTAWTVVVIVCLFYVGALATTLRLCAPIALNWDQSLQGSCGNQAAAEMWAAAINMILDVGIVALPIPIVWRLKLQTRRKVAICVTFGLGLGIAVINLARIVKVLDCSLAEDFTYCTSDSAILTVAEMAVGVMVACVPKMGHLFHRKKEVKVHDSSSGQALRYKKYLFGTGQTDMSENSQETGQVRLHSSEIAEPAGVIHHKPYLHHGARDTAAELWTEDLSLEKDPVSRETNSFAAYSPAHNQTARTSIRGDGILIAHDFEISSARTDRAGT